MQKISGLPLTQHLGHLNEMAAVTDTEIIESTVEVECDHGPSWVRRLGWIRANSQRLAKLETQILNKVSACTFTRKYVRVGDGQHLWTLIVRRRGPIRQTKSLSALAALANKPLTTAHSASSMDDVEDETFSTVDDSATVPVSEAQSAADAEYEKRTPIVLVHGMGSAAALFVKNFEKLSEKRVVYAFDLPGFGRSTRIRFPEDAVRVEQQFVDLIEMWRIEMKLDKFILIGHSFGGYLVTLYAIAYPMHVKHLVLADPWGFPCAPKDNDKTQQLPLFFRVIGRVMSPTLPFALLRVAGPFGPGLVERFRPDLQRMYSDVFDDNTILEYIYECNAQEPSGENAFRALCSELAWAKRPLIERAHQVDNQVGMTFIYGERSWIDCASGYLVRAMRPSAYVKVHVLPNTAHHVMAQCSDMFNQIVNDTCDALDVNQLVAHYDDSYVKRVALKARSNSEESIPTLGGSSNSVIAGLVSPRSSSNLEGLNWIDAKPKEKSKKKRLYRSKSKQEEFSNGEKIDEVDENGLSARDRELADAVHPRMKFFPANRELPPGLLNVQVRPISF